MANCTKDRAVPFQPRAICAKNKPRTGSQEPAESVLFKYFTPKCASLMPAWVFQGAREEPAWKRLILAQHYSPYGQSRYVITISTPEYPSLYHGQIVDSNEGFGVIHSLFWDLLKAYQQEEEQLRQEKELKQENARDEFFGH